MTEMPEVEILVRGLREHVVGRTIQTAEVLLPSAVRFPAVPEFIAQLAGCMVTSAERRAKYILLGLSDELLLGLHMMLWGTLRLAPAVEARPPHTLITWRLDRDEELRLIDQLGYARAALGTPEAVSQGLGLHLLGPEALDPGFDVAALARQIGRRRGVLKSLLLNQRVLAGLGNRDADESLWLAGLDPRRSAATLTEAELTRLHAGIREMLTEGIAQGGTQRDLLGRKGRARHRRHIFERTGLPCPRCGTAIAITRLGGRRTHYCPGCQQ
jgi:formamidopyrimidine-DNA glycosylase